MENEFFCGGNCSKCEKFSKETPNEGVGKERPKEGKQEEELDRLIKELEKKNKEEQEKYKKKK